MSHSDRPSMINRRRFISGTAGAGLAGGVAVSTAAGATPPPEKFRNMAPLYPAPELALEGLGLDPPPLAALVLNKAAYGPRPGDIEAFDALGDENTTPLESWLEYQLNPTGSDPEVDTRLADLLLSTDPADQLAYDTIDKTPLQLWTEHARHSEWSIRNRPVWQMERLTILRAVYGEWQLREVLSDFWMNHFNVYGREFPTYGMMPEYDRVLRAHIFGNFGDMLRANARTATMLYYLDNYANTWPNPNENYARELLELHTLGAVENYYGAIDPLTVGTNSKGQRAGYTEIDVFELAKALTGWGVSDSTDDSPDTGEFIFRPARHYDAWLEAPITMMDVVLTETNGEADVTDILDYLANHYGTARYIAWKLCTRLISDDPPASIVDSTADQFYDRRQDVDQLKEVYRHVILSSEFQSTWGQKVKRPVESVVRAWRATGVDLTFRLDHSASNSIWGRLDDTSHYPFGYSPPTGYPDERAFWQGSGPLIMSWRVITYMFRRDTIVNLAEQTNAHFANPVDRTARNIVNWWLYRALGYAQTPAVEDRIVEFVTSILFSLDPGFIGDFETEPLDTFTDTLTVTDMDGTATNSIYQRIVRGVVGLVLMSPEAQKR